MKLTAPSRNKFSVLLGRPTVAYPFFVRPLQTTLFTSGAAIGLMLLIGMAQSAVHSETVEVMPSKPAHYFNDYAGIASQSVGEELDRQLGQFERATSNQVVVAIFPKMQSDSDIADYTQRVAQAWGVGQKERRNGVVLFVFLEDRKMIIQVGYGLEGALPDATAFNITEYHMKPRFIAGDYEGGLRTGIDSICGAIRGEYSSKTQTVSKQTRHRRSPVLPLVLLCLIPLSLLFGLHRTARRGFTYSKAGAHWTIDWREVFFFWLSLLLSGRSGSSGGESSSSSGGGFRGGGGTFGGGGAGSSW